MERLPWLLKVRFRFLGNGRSRMFFFPGFHETVSNFGKARDRGENGKAAGLLEGFTMEAVFAFFLLLRCAGRAFRLENPALRRIQGCPSTAADLSPKQTANHLARMPRMRGC